MTSDYSQHLAHIMSFMVACHSVSFVCLAELRSETAQPEFKFEFEFLTEFQFLAAHRRDNKPPPKIWCWVLPEKERGPLVQYDNNGTCIACRFMRETCATSTRLLFVEREYVCHPLIPLNWALSVCHLCCMVALFSDRKKKKKSTKIIGLHFIRESECCYNN
jgi:hypothetical protein